MPGPRVTLSGLRPVLVMEPEFACSDCLYRDRVCSIRVLSPATNDCKLRRELLLNSSVCRICTLTCTMS